MPGKLCDVIAFLIISVASLCLLNMQQAFLSLPRYSLLPD